MSSRLVVFCRILSYVAYSSGSSIVLREDSSQIEFGVARGMTTAFVAGFDDQSVKERYTVSVVVLYMYVRGCWRRLVFDDGLTSWVLGWEGAKKRGVIAPYLR